MSDSDDNPNKSNSEDFQNGLESIPDSNIDNNNMLIKASRLSETSKADTQLMNRYTIVDKNFDDEPNDIKEVSTTYTKKTEVSNSKDSPKKEEIKEKAQNKKQDKPSINFVNFKIIVVGDVSVGKTSIIGRYINNSFDDDYKCTISAEQHTKVIKEDDTTSIKLNIWDTAGQEKFRSLTRQYYRDCQGAFIVFDITKKKTFEFIKFWIDDIKNNGNDDTVIIIMGNKSDLTGEREITMNEIQNKLNDDYLYYEVSAKNGNNITMAFDKMKKLIMENKIKNEEIEVIKPELNDKKEKRSKSKSKKKEKRTESKTLKEYNKSQKDKKCC